MCNIERKKIPRKLNNYELVSEVRNLLAKSRVSLITLFSLMPGMSRRKKKKNLCLSLLQTNSRISGLFPTERFSLYSNLRAIIHYSK